MTVTLLHGDCREVLATLPDESVQCVVTSPPYFGLRDYGVAGQIGLEPTLAAFVAQIVEVFRVVRRVLKPDGTCWVNLGDAYCSGTAAPRKATTTTGHDVPASWAGRCQSPRIPAGNGLKPKDLMGIPWRVAFALQGDGWWLRSDIIWAKPNPMPESVRDRPTKAHEYLFLLTKADRYFYDAKAIAEPLQTDPKENYPARAKITGRGTQSYTTAHNGSPSQDKSGGFHPSDDLTRNARSVWTIATEPFTEAHFATFPTELSRRCILAGTRPGDTVLDPFAGAGTTLLVADRERRGGIGIELNPEYIEIARRRIAGDAPLFSEVA